MPIKLYYFGLPGRAENARLMFTHAKKEFEDVRFTPEEWAAFKSKTPFGQLPCLEHDGKLLAESAAIDRYVASMTGFMPSDPWGVALADQCCSMLNGIWEVIIPTMKITDEAEKIKARQALVDGPIKDRLTYLTNILDGKEYIAGSDMSYADFYAFTMLSTLKSGWLDGVPTTLLENFPALKAYRNKIASHPTIKAYYENETEGARVAFKPE